MGRKLKALTDSLTENQLAMTVKDSAQQIWLAGLGAFSKAQEEGGKVFEALVKEGEIIQARTRKMTDEKIAVVTGKAAGETVAESLKRANDPGVVTYRATFPFKALHVHDGVPTVNKIIGARMQFLTPPSSNE